MSLLEPQVKIAPCVLTKEAVNDWRISSYKGITETTRLLLNHWFKTDHRLPNGRAFFYFDATARCLRAN